jgi:hypothetical protein
MRPRNGNLVTLSELASWYDSELVRSPPHITKSGSLKIEVNSGAVMIFSNIPEEFSDRGWAKYTKRNLALLVAIKRAWV